MNSATYVHIANSILLYMLQSCMISFFLIILFIYISPSFLCKQITVFSDEWIEYLDSSLHLRLLDKSDNVYITSLEYFGGSFWTHSNVDNLSHKEAKKLIKQWSYIFISVHLLRYELHIREIVCVKLWLSQYASLLIRMDPSPFQKYMRHAPLPTVQVRLVHWNQN